MRTVKTIVLQKSVFEDNDREADSVRRYLKERGVLLVNVMSSPGAGKTTTLISLIDRLKRDYSIGVMEADIDSDVDAVKIASETGVRSVQLHTGGMCHLDAGMTMQGVEEIGTDLDLIFLENVGNLVCPAEYDTGAHVDMIITSVPEGDDKPLKYPLVFKKADIVVINKTDALSFFPKFSLDRLEENIRFRNKSAAIIPLSAKTGENVGKLAEYFKKKLEK